MRRCFNRRAVGSLTGVQMFKQSEHPPAVVVWWRLGASRAVGQAGRFTGDGRRLTYQSRGDGGKEGGRRPCWSELIRDSVIEQELSKPLYHQVTYLHPLFILVETPCRPYVLITDEWRWPHTWGLTNQETPWSLCIWTGAGGSFSLYFCTFTLGLLISGHMRSDQIRSD